MKVVVLSGATATGKTDLAIALAAKFGGEIVNFDSLLLYKELDIGTAKPTAEEMRLIPHHLVNVASISSPLNAADYSRIARPVVEKLLSEKKIVYLVGGSGFYLQALIKGMYDSPSTPKEILRQSEELYQKDGITPFLEILKTYDLESFERYHENDHYRIRRATEHWWAHHTKLSEVREKKAGDQTVPHTWDILQTYLSIPREEHFEIIRRRTDRMLEAGLLQEVQGLLISGFTGLEKPLQSIGYKEVLEFLSGDLKSMEECRERINISTRQLAKAQRTWFNRDATKLSFHPLEQRAELFAQVRDFLKA